MSFSRYRNDRQIKNNTLGSSRAHRRIRRAILSGNITVRSYVAQSNERLDKIAGLQLGDGRLWWVIAMCSGIGWAPQVPPGTLLKIPTNLGEIEELT